MIQFEGMERRMAGIEACLRENGLDSLEAAEALCKEHGIDVAAIVKGVQPIAFENAVWAYTLGTAIALKKGAVPLPMPLRPSVWVCRPSVCPARLRISAR